MTDDERLVKAARRMSETLTPGDLDHVLERITAAAIEVLPDVHYASITIRREDGTLHTVAPTDPMIVQIDQAQYDFKEGPCYEAAVDTVHVTSPDLAADERFPRYAKVAVEAGIRAQAGLRLFDAPGCQGALNLYSRQVGAFADLGVLGALFTDRSAMAIAYAQNFDDARKAARDRELVGKAIGAAMERYEFNEERAFAFLTRLAQYRGVPVPAVAEALVLASNLRGFH